MGQLASVRQVGRRSWSKPMAAAAAKVGTRGAGMTGQAGGGGFAGAGGSATLTLGNATTPGILRTSGNFGHGAVVQSVGGGGGNGGSARFLRDRWCRRSRRRWRSGHGQCAQAFGGCDIGVRDRHEFDCAAGAKRRWRRRGGRRRHRSGHRRRRRDRRQWWAGRQWRPGHAEPGGGRVRFDRTRWQIRNQPCLAARVSWRRASAVRAAPAAVRP